ncbi:hypothetical protein PanWU01x14_265710 [Parasponia andersonii]|uniref:Uncharacterized protein n=1 Tax=Parasponia andersonii TaxID=3476 RepID=A0A2P5B767_PARAD|nr:hypothetical protein PanWU01x14_265710 [Parasponia andersonii]
MGIRDYISGTTESLKRNAPDLTPVKTWCSSSYGYSKSAVSNIGGSVKVNADKALKQYWPGEETRSKIGTFATSIAKYSAEESLRIYFPGGVWAPRAFKNAWNDAKKSGERRVDHVKALEATVGLLEKQVDEFRKLAEKMEMNNKQTSSSSSSSSSSSMDLKTTPTSAVVAVVENQKPEDVVRVFMMKEFIGSQLWNDLMFKPRK